MLLYYGADRLVEKPEYGKGNSANDYGKGFYLTDDIDMARLWASRFSNGHVITYEVDINKLKVLHLEDSSYDNIMAWITLLVKHRFSKADYEANKDTINWLLENYLTDIDDYDMIIGYRADDSYFAYSRDFVSNELSLETLANALKIGKLGKQYVLKSKEAFDHIRMISYKKIDRTDDYELFRMKALNEYHILKTSDDINNTFIRDIRRDKNNVGNN